MSVTFLWSHCLAAAPALSGFYLDARMEVVGGVGAGGVTSRMQGVRKEGSLQMFLNFFPHGGESRPALLNRLVC